jgi:hypothetical protein
VTITKAPTPSPSATPTPSAGALTPGEQQALQGFLGAQGAASGSPDGKVFMGMGYGVPPGADTRTRKNITELGNREAEPDWMSPDDAAGIYFTWSQKQRDDFRAKGLLSGLLTQGAGDLEAYSLWQSLVKQSALYGAQDQQVGPLDILSGYVKGNSNGGWIKQGNFEVNPLTGEKRYIGPQFKTTSQQQVDLTDPATARAVATKIFQDLLGRDPNSGEISAYANALSQSEASNPSTAVTTTQYDMATGEATNTNTVTSGGLSADAQAQIAQDQIRGKKEYGATQAATTYMNALTGAVGGGA